jgi:hypothetical protein
VIAAGQRAQRPVGRTYTGLPMAPVLNEVSGQVLVSYQDRVTRSIDASAATMQAAAQRPMLRLWWRQVQ